MEPEDEKAGTVPLYPKDKYWNAEVKEFNVVIPEPEPVAVIGTQVINPAVSD